MIKNKTKTKRIVAIMLFIVVLVIGTMFVAMSYDYSSLERDLYSLSPSTTEEELVRMGYIDLTGIQPTENIEINRFVYYAGSKQKAVLKTFQSQNGEIELKIFYSDPQVGAIRLLPYSLRAQSVTAPDKRFSTAVETIEKDDIVTIVLIHIQNQSWPVDKETAQNEVLYSYAKG